MKTPGLLRTTALLLLLLCSLAAPVRLFAEVTAFTYQGRLNNNAGPANGLYDFTFSLYDQPTGNGFFAIQTNLATQVSNGLFTVTLDFGPGASEGIFIGAGRWLEIAVRTNGGVGYATLTPREQLTATPYAITAASLVSGGLTAGTYGNAYTFNNLGNSFSGNGSALSNVNSATLGGLTPNAFWLAAGNAGTVPGANFIGTTDNQPLELQVNATRALRLEPHGSSAPSLAGGYYQNSVSGFFGSVIAGGGTSGSPSGVSGNYAFVGAGHGANAGNFSAVVGGAYNNASANFSFVGTGLSNTNWADYSFLGGGTNNLVAPSAVYSFIGGGTGNAITSPWSVVNGGYSNRVDGLWATVAGGEFNVASGYWAIVGGGSENMATDDYAMVGGGYGNVASGMNSSVACGLQNTSSEYAASVGGGWLNVASGQGTAIAGGEYNTASGLVAAVGGGYNNSALGTSAAIGGGNLNVADGYGSAIMGGLGNHSSGDYSAVSGGGNNYALGHFTAVGGGQANVIYSNTLGAFIGGGYVNSVFSNADFSVIAGGTNNTVSADRAVVGGGDGNLSSAEYATVSGGGLNHATGRAAVVAGGGGRGSGELGAYPNTASGDWSAVGGGWNNIASGHSSVVGGGANNLASATYSFAAGQQAQAVHQGAFVWADSQNAAFASTANDQFNVRAQGGARFVTGAAGLTVNGVAVATAGANTFTGTQTINGAVTVNGQTVATAGANTFTGTQTFNGALNINSSGGFDQSAIGAFSIDSPGNAGGRLRVQVNGNVGIGTNNPQSKLVVVGNNPLNPAYCDGLNWFGTSDRNAKEAFVSIDPRQVLEKVTALPITEWRYKGQTGIEHVGPMAQDFHTAFGLNGADDKHISTLDEGGVALAAIQGLNQKVEEKDAEIRKLKEQNDSLERRMSELEEMIKQTVNRK
jgi:hypothetical protein